VLVPKAINMPHAGGREIGFMPHFESAAWGAWQQVADLAGVRLIDPRSPPLGILRAIGRCRLVLSEALHGVIVADALRVPWIAIRPRARIHRTKWLDWAETMALQPQFHPLPASTLAEWMGTSRLTSFHATRAWLARYGQRLDQMTSERLVTQAAKALVAAASAAPQLSAATVLDRCQSRMLEAVETVRVQPLLALSASPGVVHPQSCLQPGNDSAYQLTPIS
jgi:succinoglycan biosynthesis protein ExoV